MAEKEDRSTYEVRAQEFLNSGDETVSGIMSKGGAWLTNQMTSGQVKAQTSDIRNILNQGVKIVEGLVNKEKGADLASAVTSLRNQSTRVPDFMLKLVDEIMGITDETRPMYELMNPVKSGVSQIRQIFRRDMPKFLSKQFTRELTAREWGHLHLLAKADIAALGKGPIDKITEILMDSKKLSAAISNAEEELSGLANSNMRSTYLKKSKDLAKFMVKREIDPDNHNLARNAEAIARNVGEKVRVKVVSPELVDAIDKLTSLYALELLDPSVTASLKALSESETKGVEFMLYYLTDLRTKEVAKATTAVARLNGYKGYVPAESRDGVSLMVVDDSEYSVMVNKGYTRIGDYKGSGFESGRKGYYYSTVEGPEQLNREAVNLEFSV